MRQQISQEISNLDYSDVQRWVRYWNQSPESKWNRTDSVSEFKLLGFVAEVTLAKKT